jgi:predicted secreted protein
VKGKAPLLILVAAAVLLALGLAACGSSGTSDSSSSPQPSASASASTQPSASASSSPAAASQTVKVDAELMPAVVDLKVGDRLQVILQSNTASTGYVWTAEGMEQEAVLKEIGKATVIPAKSKVVGAPGKTGFVFQAMQAGTEQLGFRYARPSDKGDPGASYALVVKVGKGHLPVEVITGEDHTVETAEIRSGDTLQVVINHASSQGKVAWAP